MSQRALGIDRIRARGRGGLEMVGCGRGEVEEESAGRAGQGYDMVLLARRCAISPNRRQASCQVGCAGPRKHRKKAGKASGFSAKENGDRPRTDEAARMQRPLQGPPPSKLGSGAARNCRVCALAGHMTASVMKCCRPHWPRRP